MIKHLKITVKGRVQNVGFRHKTLREAQKHNIKGFVMNQPDGSVYIEAEGEESNLNKFVNWCKEGPSWAFVEDVLVDEGTLKNFNNFSVEFSRVL